jgi:HK97 family phage prohead protease
MKKYMAYQEKNKKYLDKFDFDNGLDCRAFDYFAQNEVDLKTAGIFEVNHKFNIKGMDNETELEIGMELEIEGYLSTFGNPDRENDVVLFNAFKECLQEQKQFPLLRDHRASTDFQLGSFEAMEDSNGLRIAGKCLVTQQSFHTCLMMKKGHLNTTSMGGIFRYKRNDDGSLYRGENGIWIIEKVKLFEGSVVPVPANPKAVIVMKTFESVEENEKQVSEEQKADQVPEKSIDERMKELNKILFLKG